MVHAERFIELSCCRANLSSIRPLQSVKEKRCGLLAYDVTAEWKQSMPACGRF